MSITFDAASSMQGSGSSTYSWSHTTAAGSNLALFVSIGSAEGSGGVLTTSVTYNSVSMTEDWDFTGQSYFHNSGHHLIAPSTGTNTVAVTLAGSQSYFEAGAITLQGVDQSTPVSTAVTNNGADDAPTATISSAAGELICGGMVCYATTNTSDSGQTNRWREQNVNSLISGAGDTKAGAGSVTMLWARGSGGEQKWLVGVIAFKPASGGGGGTIQPMLMILGCGS